MKTCVSLLSLLLLGFGCLCHAISVPGVSANPQAPAGVPCLAVLQPYTVTEPTVESSPQQPTVSPVPPWVVATINMSVTDSGSAVFGDPWELQIVNPYYTELIQVTNVTHANITDGVITALVDEELEPEEGIRFYMGFVVNATENFFVPEAVMVNGNLCSVQLQNDLIPPPTLPIP